MIALIAAVAENNCIGKRGALPWYLPEDLKHFKRLTRGHVVVMGRKTWDSIPESRRPLPNRTNVVVTRQTNFAAAPNVEVYHSVADALAAHANQDVYIIGGAEIYKQTIAFADTLEITEVHRAVEGDAFFPEIDKKNWQEAARQDCGEFSFVTYRRRD